MGLDSKKDVHLDGSSVVAVSRLEVLEGPSGRRVRSEAERARIAATLSTKRRIAVCGAPRPPFAPLVVEGPLEERHIPLEIAIGDVVVRTDAAIDGEQLSRVIRAVRASR
jgi:transposase